jgi:hypothetical protein
MKANVILLLFIACGLGPLVRAQTYDWRYYGGQGDGYAMAVKETTDMSGTSLASRYKGGNHDGYAALNQNADLAGNDWTKKYLGGSYDGYAMLALGASDLVGASLAGRYLGGSYDGHAMLASGTLDLTGFSLAGHYLGGSYDGYAMLASGTLDLTGVSLAGRFLGGSYDGYAMWASNTLDLQGGSLLARYAGGSYDGYAMLPSNPLDLQGNGLLAHSQGGNDDGYAMFASELLDLAGAPLANRYKGGSYDGHALANYSPPEGNPPRFAVKIFLQGPYSGSAMTTTLNSAHYLPLAQPYGGPPWFYPGTESIGSIPSSTIVDWVLCEIRPSAAMSTVLEQHPGFLKSDGSIVALDGVSPLEFTYASAGSYYLVVRHRNHLAVMSASPIFASALGPGTIDFTTAMSNAYGTNPMKEVVTGTFGMWAGDVNANGNVRYNGASNDRAAIFSRTGSLTGVVLGYYPEDVNMNGQVKYNGSLNDRAVIFNVTGTLTGVRVSQVP